MFIYKSDPKTMSWTFFFVNMIKKKTEINKHKAVHLHVIKACNDHLVRYVTTNAS